MSVLDNVTLGLAEGAEFYSDIHITAASGNVTGAYADVWLSDEDFWNHTSSVWIRFAGIRAAYSRAVTAVQRTSGQLQDQLRRTVHDLTDSDYQLDEERALVSTT